MLPKTVTLLGESFTVKRPETVVVEGHDAEGSYDPETNIIEVASGLDKSQALSTLIHEMAHAWLDKSSLATTLNLSTQQEEGLVLALERQFVPAVAKLLGSKALVSSTAKGKAARKKKGRA